MACRKGTAHYYSLGVAGADNPDAAWYYPDPKPEAENIRGCIAFWKGVSVSGPELRRTLRPTVFLRVGVG